VVAVEELLYNWEYIVGVHLQLSFGHRTHTLLFFLIMKTGVFNGRAMHVTRQIWQTHRLLEK
jgi:hypothetical protein